ncbi:hypothetical protein HID58_036765 [Brassica napus]|uniref:Uncharacterized protein n=1 Tax=Brassica napus TaxID=3708 RepID=A0ABQ8C8N4_BRANA|nr:hypothetical protein HID58_036765 [Brassica napus]
MLMPLLRKMNFFIIFMLIIAIILGVSEAIWHQVVAPLSKCEKNRVIIRNELGPGKGCGCRILLETLKHTIQVKKIFVDRLVNGLREQMEHTFKEIELSQQRLCFLGLIKNLKKI